MAKVLTNQDRATQRGTLRQRRERLRARRTQLKKTLSNGFNVDAYRELSIVNNNIEVVNNRLRGAFNNPLPIEPVSLALGL